MGFQIAPMVDVVFVLLLFFMASAGAQIVEKELSINLPAGKSSSNGPVTTPIIIEIGPDGTVSMNSTVYGLPANKNLLELKEWLRTTIGNFGGEDPVIIRPSPDTVQERIIDVLNACAAGKVKNLTFS